MDGELLGIVGNSCILKETLITEDWYSIEGFQNQEAIDQDISDMEQLNKMLQTFTNILEVMHCIHLGEKYKSVNIFIDTIIN